VGTTSANITYIYDNDGRTTKRSIDSNSENYGYTNDELVNVTNPLGSFGYTYDPNTSNLTQISYPNGQKTNMTYYLPSNPLGAGRLQTLTNLGAGSTSGQTLSNFSYSYTQAGDINTWTQQLDNTPADSHTYTMGYDRDSELTSATLTSGTKGFDNLTANKGVTFGYDASGNRTSEQTSTYSNNFGKNNLNQLTGITPNPIPVQGSTSRPASVYVNGQAVTEDTNNNFSGSVTPAGGSTPMTIRAMASDGTQSTQTNHVLNTQAYSYDANGSISSDNMYSYVYDANNRLIQVNFLNPQPATKPDTVQMTYDGLGRRVAVTELHGTTVITATTDVWCGNDVCQERDVTGHTITKQFFSLGEQIGGTNYYFACDYLGSIREMTDASGVVHANYDYDAFGRQTKLSGDLDSDFGYTAFGIEKTLCLDLTYFRVYDPEKGRWLTRDPEGEGVGFNLYGYVDNDTIKYTDSLGLVASGSGGSPRGYHGPPPPPGTVPLLCNCALFTCGLVAPEVPLILDATDLALFDIGILPETAALTPNQVFFFITVPASGKGYLGILNSLNQLNNPPTPQQNPPNSCNGNPPPNQHHYGGTT
jgi:RHS repeat-associated protein